MNQSNHQHEFKFVTSSFSLVIRILLTLVHIVLSEIVINNIKYTQVNWTPPLVSRMFPVLN